MSTVRPSPALTLPRRRGAWLAALAGSVLALVTGCGGSSSTASPTAAGSGTAGTTVTVTETEFALAFDKPSLAPGRYTFHVVNAGKTGHALELEGPGIADQKTAVLQPGQSADLSATLQAGDYDVYCPVDGHRGMGMEVRLAIGGAGGASPAAPSSGGGNGY